MTPSSVRVASAYLERRGATSSGEAHFFDSPKGREIREFALSGELSNVADVHAALSYANTALPVVEHHHLRDSPSTPTEVVRGHPGGGDFSTLSRYVVQTWHPTDEGVPRSHAESPRHPDIKVAGSRAVNSL